jgi:hypothetical protein
MNKRLFALIISLFWLAAFAIPTAAEETSPLTPDGNLTIIDDILIENKQFITVHSRSGAEFYIVIDRSRDSDNVYFLNQVDDIDLFALLEAEKVEVKCTCKEKCATNVVNSDCLICRMDIDSCTGKEVAQTEPVIEPEPDKPEKRQNFLPIVIIILILGGGAAVYFLKLRKNKPKHTAPDLDAYDDDEYESVESESDDDTE